MQIGFATSMSDEVITVTHEFKEMHINFKFSDAEKHLTKGISFLIYLICNFEKHVIKLEAYFKQLLKIKFMFS